jgi:protein TonB
MPCRGKSIQAQANRQLMELADNIPGFTHGDRLGLTVFASVLAHMVVVLGISFTAPRLQPDLEQLPTLEITLVNTRSDRQPEEADFLAQADQEGGGDSEQPVIARSPLPLRPAPDVSRELPVAQLASRPPVPRSEREPMTQNSPAEVQLARKQPTEERSPARPQTTPGVVSKPSAAAERARLSAEISEFWEEYQKRPRRKFLSARTREYKYAAYMEAWRAKVERVGNLNYPDQARQQKLTGQLVLDVEIRRNGQVHAINIIRTSGHKLLDDAAMRIVRLAAPFDAFPEAFRGEVDILHITRTWQFMRGNRLVSR